DGRRVAPTRGLGPRRLPRSRRSRARRPPGRPRALGLGRRAAGALGHRPEADRLHHRVPAGVAGGDPPGGGADRGDRVRPRARRRPRGDDGQPQSPLPRHRRGGRNRVSRRRAAGAAFLALRGADRFVSLRRLLGRCQAPRVRSAAAVL
ncbi:MAG: Universal stress protein UspA and related nucleotide-binding proteins, partial [uncultured Thermomicrobiales bacterium]